MKTTDVEYYANQINFLTPCEAIEKKNYLTIVFPDGSRKTARTENEADNFYRDCNRIGLTDLGN